MERQEAKGWAGIGKFEKERIVKKFFSFSGGVESRVMALMFGHNAKGIFADTGWEHQALYDGIETFYAAMKMRHGEQFEIISVMREDGETLTEYMKKYKYAPSFNNRFCTRRFKIEPIDDFLKKQGKCQLMIGLNADEAGKRTGNLGKAKNVEYTYPLIEYDITRRDCESLLKELNLFPSFPSYMRRGGCQGCFFKSKKEFKLLALLNPEEAYSVADVEDSIQDIRSDHYAIRDCIPNMREFVDYHVNGQKSLFDIEEMINNEEVSSSPCGVFCHR